MESRKGMQKNRRRWLSRACVCNFSSIFQLCSSSRLYLCDSIAKEEGGGGESGEKRWMCFSPLVFPQPSAVALSMAERTRREEEKKWVLGRLVKPFDKTTTHSARTKEEEKIFVVTISLSYSSAPERALFIRISPAEQPPAKNFRKPQFFLPRARASVTNNLSV